MQCKQACVTGAALLSLSILLSPVLFDLAWACPPSKTWTTGPDDEAGFVLAEGALAAVLSLIHI